MRIEAGLDVPQFSPVGIWIGLPNGRLIAGCPIQPSDGPFVIAAAPVGPVWSKRLLIRCIYLGVAALSTYAVVQNVTVVAYPELKSVARALRRVGIAAPIGAAVCGPPFFDTNAPIDPPKRSKKRGRKR